jgi:RHS repeat-associated protein
MGVGSGTTTAFLWSTQSSIPLLLDDGINSYIYGPSGAAIAQINDGSAVIQYLHPDLVGSTRLITSSTGAVQGTTTYSAYGERLTHTGTADSAIGYTGNWTDAITGIVYLRAREFDPKTGQFLSVAPALDRTHQSYAYVANDPLLLTDPTGLEFWADFGNNALAFGAGLLDGATFGASSLILGALVPGYNCLTQNNPFFTAGSIVGTIASSIAITALTAGAGGWARRRRHRRTHWHQRSGRDRRLGGQTSRHIAGGEGWGTPRVDGCGFGNLHAQGRRVLASR